MFTINTYNSDFMLMYNLFYIIINNLRSYSSSPSVYFLFFHVNTCSFITLRLEEARPSHLSENKSCSNSPD